MGATLAALSGINNVAGPGIIDFVNCFSLEKLVIDNEIAGMSLHMLKGITPKDDFPSSQLFEELLEEQQLIIADHTRKHIKNEHFLPGRWLTDKITLVGKRMDLYLLIRWLLIRLKN